MPFDTSRNQHQDNAKRKLLELFDEAFAHDGFSELKVELRILKRRQKEVIIHFGKQFRYVVDFENDPQDR